MKLLTDETCPDCKKKFESEHELEGLEPIKHKGKIKEVDSDSTVQLQMEKPEVQEKIVEKVVEVAPSYMPAFSCKGKDCDGHQNQNYKQRPKGKGKTCDQFSKEKDGRCTWCGKSEIEELDDEKLDEIGIPMPEHTHERV